MPIGLNLFGAGRHSWVTSTRGGLVRQGVQRNDRRGACLPRETEVSLLERVVERDLRAFETLYRLYHPRLTRFLFNMTRRPALVDEVVNDTMLVVWSRPDSFNGTSKLSSWVFGIAYRKALQATRRQDLPIEDARAEQRESAEPGPEQRAGEDRSRRSLLAALNELSADHRLVVELTYFQDFGYREIAEIMDCPVDTVKSRMFYARRHLGRLLTGDLGDWL
jgi:RNA polymerase sigma-70 factor (ECF subfamily)